MSAAILQLHLEVLRHGGQDSISLFLDVSRQLNEAAEPGAVHDWVTIAAPALPEAERAELITELLNVFLSLAAEIPTNPQ
jgi:hypothetical protein